MKDHASIHGKPTLHSLPISTVVHAGVLATGSCMHTISFQCTEPSHGYFVWLLCTPAICIAGYNLLPQAFVSAAAAVVTSGLVPPDSLMFFRSCSHPALPFCSDTLIWPRLSRLAVLLQ